MRHPAQDYPAQYLAQLRRPGDPLIARTAGEYAYLSGTTNLPLAERVLSAWFSPTLTEADALRDDDPRRPTTPYDPSMGVSDWWERAKDAVRDPFGMRARAERVGIGALGLIVGAVVLVLALYLLAKGD